MSRALVIVIGTAKFLYVLYVRVLCSLHEPLTHYRGIWFFTNFALCIFSFHCFGLSEYIIIMCICVWHVYCVHYSTFVNERRKPK